MSTTAPIRIYTLAPAALRAQVMTQSDGHGVLFTPADIVRELSAAVALSAGGPANELRYRVEQLRPARVYLGQSRGRTLRISPTGATWYNGSAGIPLGSAFTLTVQGGPDVVRNGAAVLNDPVAKWRSAFGTMESGKIAFAVGEGTGIAFARALARRGVRNAVLGTEGPQTSLTIGERHYGPGEPAPLYLYAKGQARAPWGWAIIGALGLWGLYQWQQHR